MSVLYCEMEKECENDVNNYYEYFNYKVCDPHILLNLEKYKKKDKESRNNGDGNTGESEGSDSYSIMCRWESSYYPLNFSDYPVVLLFELIICGVFLTVFFFHKVVKHII